MYEEDQNQNQDPSVKVQYGPQENTYLLYNQADDSSDKEGTYLPISLQMESMSKIWINCS